MSRITQSLVMLVNVALVAGSVSVIALALAPAFA